MLEIVLCFVIPLLGTTLGASMVFFMKDKINEKLEKVLMGFAFGFILMMILDVALG